MNFVKYKNSQVNALIRHCDRKPGEFYKRNNENINSSKTHLNYNYINSLHTAYERYQNRLNEVKHLKRDDVKTLCDWLVTMPKDYKGDTQEFFDAVFTYLSEKYGKENIIYANVHMDETTPHMHFGFIPVVRDQKGIEKVSAKECVTRNDLMKMHPDMQKYLDKRLPEKCNIMNGATDGGNKTIEKLKAEQLAEQNKQQQDVINYQKQLIIAQNELLNQIKEKCQALQKKLIQGRTELAELTQDIQYILDMQKFIDIAKTTNRYGEVVAIKDGFEQFQAREHQQSYDNNDLEYRERE